jgi:hypothetical protein
MEDCKVQAAAHLRRSIPAHQWRVTESRTYACSLRCCNRVAATGHFGSRMHADAEHSIRADVAFAWLQNVNVY